MTPTSPPTLAQCKTCTERPGFVRVMGKNPMLGAWEDCPDCELGKLNEFQARALIATLHSQIDGLMKRLLRDEQDARRYRWLRRYENFDAVVTFTRNEKVQPSVVWNERMDEAIDSYLASQGGGDG